MELGSGLLTTPENTITYHNTPCCRPKILQKHCFQFLLGVKEAPRETEINAYAKFWGDKQGVLWYVVVFSGVVNSFVARGDEIPKETGVSAHQAKKFYILLFCILDIQCKIFP